MNELINPQGLVQILVIITVLTLYYVATHRYHVPRSFLKDTGNNVLVLFEEMGGNPVHISLNTVSIAD